MNSSLIKRLPGILAVGLVALAVGAAGTTAVASNDASVSGLTPKQKKAKTKAIKKCKKIRKTAKRNACIRKVKKRFAPKPPKPPVGVTKTVSVVDDAFNPDNLTVNSGDSIDWIWSNDNANAHNVTLVQGPNNLTATDQYNLSTPNSPSVQYSFKRKLTKPGTYDFICTLHSTVMDLQVKVNK